MTKLLKIAKMLNWDELIWPNYYYPLGKKLQLFKFLWIIIFEQNIIIPIIKFLALSNSLVVG